MYNLFCLFPSVYLAAHVTVHVSDSSDNPPFFEQLSYECVLSQEATRGQFVTVLSADDPDQIDSNKLIYTIVEGNEQQTYHMDSSTGIITLMNMQNFGDTHIAVLNVSVTDGVYTSYTRVKISILPANLHNPTFEQLVYEAKVNENQLAGRLVTSVKAKDDDFGKYGKVTYAIVSDEMKEIFDIDAETGDVITKIKLDREARKSYEVLVMATDEGGRSGFTSVRVAVADENEVSVLSFYDFVVSVLNLTFIFLLSIPPAVPTPVYKHRIQNSHPRQPLTKHCVFVDQSH